jgi:hypothetical protein
MNKFSLRGWLAAFWTILAVLAGVIFALRFQSVLERGPYYATTMCEDISIVNFSRIHHGDPVYVDCFTYPYRCSLFNWFYYQLYGTVVAALQPSEFALATVLRLVTLAWALVGFAALFWFLRRVPAHDSSAAAWLMDGSVAFVTWLGPTIGWWSLTARPDVPAVVLELLGLIVVIRGGERRSWWHVLAAGLLFFLAWSLKQSAVFLFAGTLLALVLRREWARAASIGGLFAVLVSAVLLTAPPAYFSNVFEAPSLAPLQPSRLVLIGYWCLISWVPLLLVGVVLVLMCLPAGQRASLFRTRPVFVLSIAGGVTLVMNLVFVQRLGSWGNYLFETWVAGMALSGLIQRQVASALQEGSGQSAPEGLSLPASAVGLQERDRVGPVARLTSLLLVCCVVSTVPLFRQPLPGETVVSEGMTARLPPPAYSEELLEDLRRSPGPIFCDDMVPFITCTPPSFLVRQALGSHAAGVPIIEHTVYWDAERATSARWPNGRLSHPNVEERIKLHQYGSIWLYTEHSTWEPVVKAAGYEVVKEDGMFRQYRYRSGPPSN